MSLSHLVFRAGCGIRLYQFLIIALSSTFENIFGINVFLMNTMLLKFQIFTLLLLGYEMGGNLRLQNGLNLLCQVYPSGPHFQTL